MKSSFAFILQQFTSSMASSSSMGFFLFVYGRSFGKVVPFPVARSLHECGSHVSSVQCGDGILEACSFFFFLSESPRLCFASSLGPRVDEIWGHFVPTFVHIFLHKANSDDDVILFMDVLYCIVF